KLAEAVGPHPAIRRSYRKWIAELSEQNPDNADLVFRSAISHTVTKNQCLDDTLIAILKSPYSHAFLARHKAELLNNEMQVFLRVIHLLRVACVKTPWWMSSVSRSEMTLSVPDDNL